MQKTPAHLAERSSVAIGLQQLVLEIKHCLSDA